MLIIDEKAEERFITDIETLIASGSTKSCLWIKGNSVAEEKRTAFNPQSICAKIEAYVDDAKTHVYQCADGDLFILTEELSEKNYREIAGIISKWLGASVLEVIALYDLSLQLQ